MLRNSWLSEAVAVPGVELVTQRVPGAGVLCPGSAARAADGLARVVVVHPLGAGVEEALRPQRPRFCHIVVWRNVEPALGRPMCTKTRRAIASFPWSSPRRGAVRARSGLESVGVLLRGSRVDLAASCWASGTSSSCTTSVSSASRRLRRRDSCISSLELGDPSAQLVDLGLAGRERVPADRASRRRAPSGPCPAPRSSSSGHLFSRSEEGHDVYDASRPGAGAAGHAR